MPGCGPGERPFTDNSADAQLTKLAKDKAATDKITFERAYQIALTENPELAAKVI